MLKRLKLKTAEELLEKSCFSNADWVKRKILQVIRKKSKFDVLKNSIFFYYTVQKAKSVDDIHATRTATQASEASLSHYEVCNNNYLKSSIRRLVAIA